MNEKSLSTSRMIEFYEAVNEISNGNWHPLRVHAEKWLEIDKKDDDTIKIIDSLLNVISIAYQQHDILSGNKYILEAKLHVDTLSSDDFDENWSIENMGITKAAFQDRIRKLEYLEETFKKLL